MICLPQRKHSCWIDNITIHYYVWLQSSGDRVQLTETNGIDILGNLIEASILSQNTTLYGNLHNFGHLAIAYIHDPQNRYLVKKK